MNQLRPAKPAVYARAGARVGAGRPANAAQPMAAALATKQRAKPTPCQRALARLRNRHRISSFSVTASWDRRKIRANGHDSR